MNFCGGTNTNQATEGWYWGQPTTYHHNVYDRHFWHASRVKVVAWQARHTRSWTVSLCRYSNDDWVCSISPIWILQFHRKLLCCYFFSLKPLSPLTAPDRLLIKKVSLSIPWPCQRRPCSEWGGGRQTGESETRGRDDDLLPPTVPVFFLF